MIGLLCFVLAVLASPFKSKLRLQAENAVLRHQLMSWGVGCMVASGSRTMIAGSLSNCIAGFHQSWRFSQSSGPRRSCVGTEPAFLANSFNSIDVKQTMDRGGHAADARLTGRALPWTNYQFLKYNLIVSVKCGPMSAPRQMEY